jgi:hypothetical protein
LVIVGNSCGFGSGSGGGGGHAMVTEEKLVRFCFRRLWFGSGDDWRCGGGGGASLVLVLASISDNDLVWSDGGGG